MPVLGEPSSRHDEMDVGMVLELAAPGVQDSETADLICADEASVAGELAQGGRGRMEQGRIGESLMAPQEGAEFLGHGESDQEVGTG